MDDKHAIVHRIIEADVVEMDGNKIVKRHGATLMPGSPVHFLFLNGRKRVDACLERPRLVGLRGGRRQ